MDTKTAKRKPAARELVQARQQRRDSRPHELPLEPQKPAAATGAGKELETVRKEPAVVRATNGDYRARYLDEIAPTGIVGRRIKFTKDGTFVIHDDGAEIDRDRVFVALCDQTLVGHLKFNGPGEKTDQRMGLLYAGFVVTPTELLPDRDEATWELGLNGEPEDPWTHRMYLVLEDGESHELFTFDTSSNTGRRAVGNLLRHYDRLTRSKPDHYPRVWLRTGGFEHRDSRVGFVSTPMFVPCGSRPADSTAKPDTSTGGIIDDDIPF